MKKFLISVLMIITLSVLFMETSKAENVYEKNKESVLIEKNIIKNTTSNDIINEEKEVDINKENKDNDWKKSIIYMFYIVCLFSGGGIVIF